MEETSALQSFEGFKDFTFEKKFKIACKWNRMQWREAGLENTRFHTVINSANYWRVKLQEGFTKNNVILATYNDNQDVFYNAVEIVDYLEESFPQIEITAYNKFRNRRFLAIDFKDENMKNFVLDNFKEMFDSHIYFLSWASKNETTVIRAHWLPRDVGEESLINKISCYLHIADIIRETTNHKSGKSHVSGAIAFYGKLKEGVCLDNIPHIMYVGSLEVLIVIAGRASLCLVCNSLGHRAYQCGMFYCKICKSKKPKQHLCEADVVIKPTYANIINNSEVLKAREEEEVSNEWISNADFVSTDEYNNSGVGTLNVELNEVKGNKEDKFPFAEMNGEGFKKNNKDVNVAPKAGEDTFTVVSKKSTKKLENNLTSKPEDMDVQTQATKRKLEESKQKIKDNIESRPLEINLTRRMITRGSSKVNNNLFENLSDEGGGEGGGNT